MPLDAKVASVLDNHRPSTTDSDDEDALISALEDDNDSSLSAFREQRLQQLHAEVARAKEMRNVGHGSYTEVMDEKALMEMTTAKENRLCVVHFFHRDFGRCGVMDGHLETLAPTHLDTRFLRINVEAAPFLVTKLNIKVLPCVLAFVDGISVDRIVGFEGLGRTPDTFTTRDLEARLLRAGVLVRAKITGEDAGGRTGTIGKGRSRKLESDEDEGDDWD